MAENTVGEARKITIKETIRFPMCQCCKIKINIVQPHFIFFFIFSKIAFLTFFQYFFQIVKGENSFISVLVFDKS